MAREEDIGVLRRELVAICEWDKMLSYCLSGDTRKLYSEEVQSYKARVLRRREIVRKIDTLVTREEKLRQTP